MFESVTPKPMSRARKCAIFGLAMTLLARVGPWRWPGWPALTLLDFVLARWAPSVLSPVVKAFGTVALLLVNAGFWGVIAWTALLLRDVARSR